MGCGKRFPAIILSIIFYISIVRADNGTEVKDCITGEDYRTDCNRCWCVKDGILVCDVMDCKALPRKMWRKVKLTKIDQVDRSIHLAVLKVVGKRVLKKTAVKIYPYVIQGVKKLVDQAVTEVMKSEIKKAVNKAVTVTKEKVTKLADEVWSAVTRWWSFG